ncbi:uncharacterized protein LOC143906658 [Temnothorax americanus]|uniref:uncharacterized protein LOC143906658 n=1 Tax=Temnothorax americanus TaxID=1964332 RepID=UPI004067C3FE
MHIKDLFFHRRFHLHTFATIVNSNDPNPHMHTIKAILQLQNANVISSDSSELTERNVQVNNENSESFIEDFNRQYSEKESIFPKKWNIIKKVIIDQLQQLNKRLSVTDTALISILPAISSVKQNAVIFYLLPIFIESRRAGSYKRKRNTNCEQDSENSVRKLTLQECREAFMLHVQTVADLDRALDDLKRRLQRNKDTFQPTPLIVGPLVNIESSYVIVNDQKFKVDSYLQAFELTFKIFFAVDCKYPTYAETFWIFLQKTGFDIHLQDKCNNSLNILLGRVNAEMERLLAT